MSHHLLQSSKLIAASTFSVMLGVTLSGCSTTSETFDCKAGQGVGCKSISEVNHMVDQGNFGGIVEKDATLARDKQSILPLESAPLSTSIISGDPLPIEHSNALTVHRMPEEHLRVWVAPFQDQQGNLHEGSVIYTLLKSGYWQLKPSSHNTKDLNVNTTTNLNLEESE